LAGVGQALGSVLQLASAAAVLAAANVPAADPILVYPVGMQAGWITNMLVLHGNNLDEARILIHAPFDTTDADGHQFAHFVAKERCYAGYAVNNVNCNAAIAVSACALSVTYHVSSDANDRALYPAPVIPQGARVDANMASRPTLHTLAQAFPDLANAVRAGQAANTPLGRKAALVPIYTKAPLVARPNAVVMPDVMLATKSTMHTATKTETDEADDEEDEGEEQEPDATPVRNSHSAARNRMQKRWPTVLTPE